MRVKKYQVENNKKIYSVYCITNILTDKKYIGYTSYNPHYRYKLHITASNSQCKSKDKKQHIHNAMTKHGIVNFEFSVLYQSYDEIHSINMEKYFINDYNTFGGISGYNHTTGGEIVKRSEATRKKHSKTMKGRKQSKEHANKRGLLIRGANNGMYGSIPKIPFTSDVSKLGVIAKKVRNGRFWFWYKDNSGKIFKFKLKSESIIHTKLKFIALRMTKYRNSYSNNFQYIGFYEFESDFIK